MFQSIQEIVQGISGAATLEGDRLTVTNAGALSHDAIDRLAWTSSFAATPELRGTARWVIREAAAARGIRPASIHHLYMAMGRGEVSGFTVPAMNVRGSGAELIVRSNRNSTGNEASLMAGGV